MKRKGIIVVIIVYAAFLVCYAGVLDYKIQNSTITSCDNNEEAHLRVSVYKAFWNPYLYKSVEEEFNRDYRKPDKLIIDLYAFGWHKYRTVVFDYDEHIEYALIEHI